MTLSSGPADGLSVAVEPDQAAVDGAVSVKGRSPRQIVWARFRRDKVTMVSLVFAILFLILAAIAPKLRDWGIIQPDKFNPELVTELGSMPSGFAGGMSLSHPLGVEPGTGRDLLSRIVVGLTTSLTVAVLAALFAIVLGTTLGLISGFSGGVVDTLISRFMDLVLSFPQVLMLLALSPIIKERMANLMNIPSTDPKATTAFMMVTLGFFGWPVFARIIRGQVLSLREREFVEAARSLGARPWRLYVKELLPHLWAPILVYTTLIMPQFIAAEAALGFLGVSFNPPTASLGAILNDSVNYAQPDPAFFIFPGLTVFFLVLAFNLLGDGLRDALDPKAGRA